MDERLIQVFLDTSPNMPRNDTTRQEFRAHRERLFRDNLDAVVERVWDLPSLIVRHSGEYVSLLVEARELYLSGHFYSCVAACGIVNERLIKDALRAAVLINRGGKPEPPSDAALDQLERVDLSALAEFVKEAGVLDEETAKASHALSELRNRYAHARGKSPQADALKAIRFLDTVISGTVSVFRDFEFADGKLVPKASRSE
jgi:hypothetical protein